MRMSLQTDGGSKGGRNRRKKEVRMRKAGNGKPEGGREGKERRANDDT